MEVRNGGWKDEDVAGNRRADGGEQGENKANRVMRFQKAEEQEEN